jgi:hypothetical protein
MFGNWFLFRLDYPTEESICLLIASLELRKILRIAQLDNREQKIGDGLMLHLGIQVS